MDTELHRYKRRSRTRLHDQEPDVELLALERPAAERLRLVSTAPTASTSRSASASPARFRDLLEDWSIEVSSPGPERPLTKPEHFQRFLGSTVRVKTSEEIAGPQQLHRHV